MDWNWEIFEHLAEFVYVADMDTHELLYMNHSLRHALEVDEPDGYRGMPCHLLLQGRAAPCEFCSNKRLREGELYHWNYQNPLLKQRVEIQDTALNWNGRRCRLEIARAASEALEQGYGALLCAYSDSLVNECLQRTHACTDPDRALEVLLAFVGERFGCDRAYLFECSGEAALDNTYEWCAPGVLPQKQVLQGEPLETIDWWLPAFERGELVVVEDVEQIRTRHPAAYGAMKYQNIRSLVAAPLRSEEHFAGFLGVDNPGRETLPMLRPFLHVIGYFVTSILKRRDLIQRLEFLSFHDQLTGARNRHAMSEACARRQTWTKMGVVYCDISGLKQVNDLLGHEAGDHLIVECCRLLEENFPKEGVFRTGGDEFVILCPDMDKQEFERRTRQLRGQVEQGGHHIAVGATWTGDGPTNLQALITQADEAMYEDKRDYYDEVSARTGVQIHRKGPRQQERVEAPSLFGQFIQKSYFDPQSLFESITMEGAPNYLFFGDMQSNLFYISDNLRDTFGFSGNVVSDLLGAWEKRISYPEDLELYRGDIAAMLVEKRTTHNLRYRVRDRKGNQVWIHCRGSLRWSEDGSRPLFFSGCISRQAQDFIIDPVTNIPRVYTAILMLSQLQKQGLSFSVVGFCLHNFSEINESRGRETADRLLRQVADQLGEHFGQSLQLYRLDGLRFMAVVPQGSLTPEQAATEIRALIERAYRSFDILVRVPSSQGILHAKDTAGPPQGIIERTLALLAHAKDFPQLDYVVHSPQELLRQRAQAQLALELSRCVVNGCAGFRMVVQPILAADGKTIAGGEALLRWRFHGRDVQPDVFIPLLEKNKQILTVGRWLFEQAVRACGRLTTLSPDFFLSFNVSYPQIMDQGFLPFMRQTLERYRSDGSHLLMELTETHFNETPEQLEHFVEQCKELGMSVALDDFGEGYSSLSLLLRCPANVVKLDRSLLHQLSRSPDRRKFIESIVYACHQFGKQVCAEGVETEAEARLVMAAGCDLIQGFYYGVPMEVSQLYDLLGQQG